MDQHNHTQDTAILLGIVTVIYWIVSIYFLIIVIGIPLGFVLSLGHLEIENAWSIPIVVALFFLLRFYKGRLEERLH